MSATDDIRVLLGEHGVNCEIHDTKKRKDTLWDFRESSHAMFSEYRDGTTVFVMSGSLWTPEQAVEATLGRSECRFRTVERFIDARRSRADMCECDRCGYRCARGFIQDERFKYCPNCGARIEVDE